MMLVMALVSLVSLVVVSAAHSLQFYIQVLNGGVSFIITHIIIVIIAMFMIKLTVIAYHYQQVNIDTHHYWLKPGEHVVA